jgi:hypothetical protein
MIELNSEWKQQKRDSWVLVYKEDIWFGKQKENCPSYCFLYELYCIYYIDTVSYCTKCIYNVYLLPPSYPEHTPFLALWRDSAGRDANADTPILYV